MKDISTGLDAEVPEGPEGKDNLMKVQPVCISERNTDKRCSKNACLDLMLALCSPAIILGRHCKSKSSTTRNGIEASITLATYLDI